MKKLLSSLVVFFVVIGLLLPFSNFADAAKVKATTKAKVTGKIGLKMEYTYKNDEKNLLKKMKKAVKKDTDNRWVFKGDTLIRTVYAKKGYVSIGDKTTSINSNGEYTFDNITPGKYKLEIKYNNEVVENKEIHVKKGLNHINVITNKSFEKTFSDMDKKKQKMIETMKAGAKLSKYTSGPNYSNTPGGGGGGDIQIDETGEKGWTGAYVDCNRFNGTIGNNTYYPENMWHIAQAVTNFYHSDCDYAAIPYGCVMSGNQKCNGLFEYSGYVNPNPHDCSSAIGDSIHFHFR